MKNLSIIFLLITLVSCNLQNNNPYDEHNYILIRTDSFNGAIDSKLYIHKNDTSRKLQFYYYDNSRLLSKGFTHHGKVDGKFEFYSYQGNLLQMDSFIDGKKIRTHSYVPPDTSIRIFKDGKLSPIDTSKNILDQLKQ